MAYRMILRREHQRQWGVSRITERTDIASAVFGLLVLFPPAPEPFPFVLGVLDTLVVAL